MGWLNSEKPPNRYDAAYLKLLVEKLRLAINFMDENNFPNGINGTIIQQRSIPMAALSQGEWHIPIVALANPITTTSTTLVNVGPFVYWSPQAWSSGASVFLEVTGGAIAEGATARFEIHGTGGMIGFVESSEAGYRWLRSTKLEMPKESQTLLMKYKTSNASVATGLLGARLIIIP